MSERLLDLVDDLCAALAYRIPPHERLRALAIAERLRARLVAIEQRLAEDGLTIPEDSA